MRRVLALLGILLGLSLRPVAQQDAVSYLLSRTNTLRSAQGLPAYSIHPALTSAANNQARWMAQTGRISHYQDDGSGPRQRAQNGGFPSSWVVENIYMGGSAGPEAAWNRWLASPVHYAGLTSPNYDMVGIGSAGGRAQAAFVMVFGNSTGRVAGSGSTSAGGSVPAAPPSYVLGLDEVGNIKHEVQLGQTLGDIALIYGYTWEDISYMLEINGMTQEDIRLIQPGSVFLVPPKDGTFTPTSEAPSVTETATMTATREPRQETATPAAEEIRPATEPAALRDLRIGLPPDIRSTPTVSSAQAGEGSANAWVQVLAAAIVVQVGILFGAAFALLLRLR